MTHRTAAARTETLVLIDWRDADLDVTPVIDRLGDAVVMTTTTTEPRRADRPAEVVAVHRITFDAGIVRNTDAHGAGCAAGFVTHVEP